MILALLFFLPLGAAFFLYYGPVRWRPARQVNHGDLIDPARPLPTVALPIAAKPTVDQPLIGKASMGHPVMGQPQMGQPVMGQPQMGQPFHGGKWTLLYYGSGKCSAQCRTDLYATRQIRAALNRDMDRVQRIFIAQGECCDWSYLDSDHPDLVTLRATAAADPLLELLPSFKGVPPLLAERLYLIDPLGNLMMSYAPDAEPKGMLEDLKRLLGLSHVG